MQNIKNLINLLEISIKDEPENSLNSWNIIKTWYNSEVDEIRNIIENSKDWLNNYQNQLIEQTWISTLKIKYTNLIWYFIEIQKSKINLVPDYFILKQSNLSSSKYLTKELKDFSDKFFEWESKLSNKEYNLFLEIRAEILNNFGELKKISEKTAFIDFTSNLAFVAYENNYSRPKMNNNYDLEIIWWRHPVIEKIEKSFISNELNLTKNNYINIITWPNMWWKSTYLRQNALIILLAHIWSFVPAKSSNIPLTDKLFSRVWSTDNLYLWQSTFMVEMQEVANILNNSTAKSFVIIDEIWRWTSTYDWMSLAWAILKENHDNIKAKTLFATHYHELIDDSKSLKWVKNFSVAVWENEENLVFLRKIIPWGIKKSFWIEVAKIAWLNNNIINEARLMLRKLESEHKNNWTTQLTFWNFSIEPEVKIIKEESKIEKEIKELNLNDLTPIEALNKINEWKNKV